MTASAALDVWNERELRRELLRIANAQKPGDRARFYARSWALITRLRAGRSSEYYLARVVTDLCTPRAPSVIERTVLRSAPPLKALPCHWNVADQCVGAGCVHFEAKEKTCRKDRAFFEKLYGPGATGPQYE